MTNESVTNSLGAYLAEFNPEKIPDSSRTESKRAVLDFLGVALRGSCEDAGRIAADFASSQFGSGAALVLGRRNRLAPVGAAFANGTAGHALDYDDIGLNVGHPTTAILPAALAVAE